MATSSETVVPPIFTRLGPQISLFIPEDVAIGQLIILCTWLGAAKKHIAKYTAAYQKIAPKSRILLIESAVPILVSSYPVQRDAIKPAVQTVRAVLDECGYHKDSSDCWRTPSNPARIVLHTFSNGGTNSATQMLIVLNRQLDMPLPLFGLICDSGPAKGTYWKSYNSMVFSLPKGIISQTLGPLAIHTILCLLYLSIACGRYGKPEDLFRETLLSAKMVKSAQAPDRSSSVCYIFSKADRMVEWADVTDHGMDARAKGWQVKELVFEDSTHCNHFSKHEKEYFDAMKAMWEGEGLDNIGARRLTANL